jgi:hypothetical protein
MDDDPPNPVQPSCLTGRSNETLLLMSTLGSWVLFLFWPLTLFFELPIIFDLVVRKSGLWRFAILFSFTTVVFLSAVFSSVIGYFVGAVEYPWCYFKEADRSSIIGHFSPRFRCNYSTWGSDERPLAFAYVFYWPQAQTIDACYALFGPVKRTYHGPLPNKGEVIALANSKSCQQVPLAEFKSGSFQVAGTSLQLQHGAVAAALHGIRQLDPGRPIELDATQANIIYAELYKGGCLVLIAPGASTFKDRPEALWIISLVDPATGKLFAQDIY